jgi:hypothetical protein
MTDDNQIDPELKRQMLYELGAAGKLWALEVEYNLDNETKLIRWRNLPDAELQLRRESIFKVGIPLFIEPGHWRIICPMDIAKVDVYRQNGYFPE